MSCLVFVTISPLTAAQIMLMLDRYVGSHFFDTQAAVGGSVDALLLIFGHPEVYVLILPASPSPTKSFRYSRAKPFSATRRCGRVGRHRLYQPQRLGTPHFTIGMTSGANTFFVLATWPSPCPRALRYSTGWPRCGGKIHFTVAMMFAIGFCSSS